MGRDQDTGGCHGSVNIYDQLSGEIIPVDGALKTVDGEAGEAVAGDGTEAGFVEKHMD